MEYQRIIKLFNHAPNQPFKFRTKDWVEIKDDSSGTYSEYNQIRFKNSMLRPILCDYRDAYIPVKGTTTVANTVAQD